MTQPSDPANTHERRLSSEDLAALIVDRLVDEGLIAAHEFEQAVQYAAEEIDVRKAAGDY